MKLHRMYGTLSFPRSRLAKHYMQEGQTHAYLSEVIFDGRWCPFFWNTLHRALSGDRNGVTTKRMETITIRQVGGLMLTNELFIQFRARLAATIQFVANLYCASVLCACVCVCDTHNDARHLTFDAILLNI